MKVSELKQLIKEEIVKVLSENEDWFKPTHISKVDWYLVYDSPNKSGTMVAHDPNSKLDTPEGELLIQQGEELMKHGNNMYNYEEVDVPFNEKYFDKI